MVQIHSGPVRTKKDFAFELDKRSGQVLPAVKILTAEVPLRTVAWTVLEGMVAALSLRIILGCASRTTNKLKCFCPLDCVIYNPLTMMARLHWVVPIERRRSFLCRADRAAVSARVAISAVMILSLQICLI